VIGPDNTIYEGDGSSIYSLDSVNGNVKWKHQIEEPTAPLVKFNNVIYIAGRVRVEALDSATGIAIWSVPTAQNLASLGGTSGGDDLYGQSGGLYSLDPATAGVRWSKNIGPNAIDNIPSPAVNSSNRLVYIANSKERTLYAFESASGKLRWKSTTTGSNA
jgi:outer membrane protein assembly factor BamB